MIEACGLGGCSVPDRRPTTLAPELTSYLAVLLEPAREGQFLELRWRAGAGMRRRFVPASHPGLSRRLIAELAARTDVYVGVALRDGPRNTISRCVFLHVEIDHPNAIERTACFVHEPALLVSSGSPGHLHAYWRLREAVTPELARAANVALAERLGGDLASCDAARILRPAGTLNHKHDPPRAVRLLAAKSDALHGFEDLTNGLGLRVKRRGGRVRRARLPHGLDRVPAEVYVPALCGRRPDTAGKVPCPFHEDGTPSMQLYGLRGFYCFGCGAGGSIVDFAARLWGIGPRGAGFQEIVERLAVRFPPRAAGRSGDFRIP